MDAKKTGELIAQCRKARGLSQGELASRLHVTDKAVSKWETGRGMPGIDTLEPLAEALGLSVSELLSGQRLTAEELPKAADGQIVESMRTGVRRARLGVLAALAAVGILAVLAVGLYRTAHYRASVAESDMAGLTAQAAAYLGRNGGDRWDFDYDALRIVETERRGDYLAALCTDDQGHWALCVYDRDDVFPDRWRANGGKPSLDDGTLGSWNFGTGGDAVLIFCGGGLPEAAASYTFQNSGITYTCPIADGQVLDIFLLPDTSDISSYPEELLDETGAPLDGSSEGTAVPAP